MHKFSSKRKYLRSILTGAFFVFCLCLKGQGDNNSTPETDQEVILLDDNIALDTAKREHYHSPKIAMLSSALLPGLGQIYNEKYWKVPIIWGAGMGMYFYIDYSNTLYQRLKLASEQLSRGEVITDPDLVELSATTLSSKKDYWRRNRDRAVLLTGVLYVANIIDAMVDAYLLDYDISQDLTLHWEPALLPIEGHGQNYASSVVGVNIQLRFK